MIVYVQDGDDDRIMVPRALAGVLDEDVAFVRWNEHGGSGGSCTRRRSAEEALLLMTIWERRKERQGDEKG
jgi:hypothetical protein